MNPCLIREPKNVIVGISTLADTKTPIPDINITQNYQG